LEPEPDPPELDPPELESELELESEPPDDFADEDSDVLVASDLAPSFGAEPDPFGLDRESVR
jgi:hypothetical protein